MSERRFPIYSINVRWSQDETPDWCRAKLGEGWAAHWQGLPDGRIWNSVSQMRRMFRTEQPIESLRAATLEWWDKYDKKGGNPGEPEIDITLAEHEEWCLSWFSHWTFDDGQKDAEVLRSFESFLSRKGVELRYDSYDGYGPDYRDGQYCAMGGEDRWRWCGRTHGGKDSERTDPPCRCDGCKAAGVIRIDH